MDDSIVTETLHDEAFWQLPQPERKKVLLKIDPDFAELPATEQDKFVSFGAERMMGPEPSPQRAYREPAAPVSATEEGKPRREGMAAEMPAVAGGIAGGIAFGPLGIAPGAAAGKGFQQAYHALTGQWDKVPPTAMDRASDMAWVGGREAVLGKAGDVAVKGAQKVLAPFAKTVGPKAQRAITFLKGKIKSAPELTPSEATDAFALDVIENISGASILGGKGLAAYKHNRMKLMESIADDLIDEFGKRAEPDVVGELVVATINKKFNAAKAVTTPMYNHIEKMTQPVLEKVPVQELVPSSLLDDLGKPIMKKVTRMVDQEVGGAKISLSEIKKFARTALKTARKMKGFESSQAGDDLLEAIIDMDEVVDYATAKELRTRFMSKAEGLQLINKKAPAIGLANKLQNMIDDATSKGLKTFDQDAYKLWRETNTTYKAIQKTFNNTFLKRLIRKADPDLAGGYNEAESLAKAIFKKGAISNIRKAKAAVDEPTFKQLQSYYIQHLFAASTNKKTGEIVGSELLAQMYGKAGMGKKTLQEIFSPSHLNTIKEFGNALMIQQTKTGIGTGKVWIQLTQATAVGVALTGGVLSDEGKYGYGAAGVILLGPAIASRILLNPEAARWLTVGLKLPKHSSAVGSVLTRLSRATWRIENDHKKYLSEDQPRRTIK